MTTTRRTRLDRPDWLALAASPHPGLVALWADTLEVHALLDGPLLLSVAVAGGTYPALSPVRPEAAPFERAVHDLWGHRAEGGDTRPWFHPEDWPVRHPLSARPALPPGRPEPEEPPPVAEEHQVLLSGPVRPGLHEPALLRVVTEGRSVVSAEVRLGWAHKGVLAAMRSKSPRAAARVAARLQADSTVAHATAFARAAEDASGVAVPPRAVALRELMATLEAVAATLVAAGRASPSARVGPAVDALRRACAAAFGHRLMMDGVVPGGVLADLRPGGANALRAALGQVPAGHAPLVAEALDTLDTLPPGALSAPLPPVSGEGLGRAATPLGDVWHWLRLDNGTVANAFACDPGWHAWHRFAAGLAGTVPGPRGLPAPFLPVSGADL